MEFLENFLYIKQSLIPGAGKGLYTREFISRGIIIIEYKGRITTWKEIQENEIFNPYVYYITRNHVIDGQHNKKDKARYANDAKGISKVAGLTNNSKYIEQKKRVFIQATKNIPANTEILVGYGKEYWDVIRQNQKV